MNVKPVNFKFGEYLNSGLELLKKDYGNFILAYFFCFIMSIIPFCSLLAIGNFYKYCEKVHNNQQASPGEIFNFDDFASYFVLNLIIFVAFIIGYIPLMILMPAASIFSQNNEFAAGIMGIIGIVYMFAFIITLFIILAKAYYIPGLISLKKITDFKEVWRISSIMTKNNLIVILLFTIVVSFLGQIGAVLCGIGIFLTLPFVYTSNYMAFRDAFQQIDKDEIKEIGNRNY